MRLVTVLLIALAALLVVGATASAQTPYIGVFFAVSPNCNGITDTAIPPGVFGAIDSLYVIAYNFSCFVTGVQLKVEYPPVCMQWVADIGTQPVTIGSTDTGMSMGWALPQNNFPPNPLCIATVIFQWVCTDCSQTNIPVRVVGHPLFNPLNPEYTCFNQIGTFPAEGLTALICPTVPVEDTTWGQVKSLYGQ